MMPSKQAMLATAAVIGFRFGGPLTRRAISTFVPGAASLSDDVIGAVASAVTFLVAKRLLR